MSTEDLYLGKKSYSVLGKRPVRHDGADKVTGKAVYTSDLHLPNMAQGKIIRSPHAHAKIKSIYTAAALKLPGVLAVVTGEDWPNLEEKFAIMGEAGAVNLTHLANPQVLPLVYNFLSLNCRHLPAVTTPSALMESK